MDGIEELDIEQTVNNKQELKNLIKKILNDQFNDLKYWLENSKLNFKEKIKNISKWISQGEDDFDKIIGDIGFKRLEDGRPQSAHFALCKR